MSDANDTRVGRRIRAPGPKRILALDGGGILGLLSVEVLARIEDMLRTELGAGPDFVLADYFDFVAGTSTGAVISACIAVGMPVTKIRSFYLESGREMFDPSSLLARLHYKYDDEPLARKLQSEFGKDTRLGSDALRCLLMMVTRNATTDSPWPVTNNPFAKYNATARDDCNLQLPLWQLIRASTAAPTFFPPEVVSTGRHTFVFVDGGVTTYNNPAWLAFLTATLQPYGVNWQTGEDRMLVVSVGTGNAAKLDETLRPAQMHLLYQASNIPTALMNAAAAGQDLFCRSFGRCLVGDPIDREIGDLIGAAGPVSPKLFTYLRYDADVSRAGLDALGLLDVSPAHVQRMDSVEHVDAIARVGQAVAARKVRREHFSAFLGS